jgi:hypothetical protein
MSQLHTSRNAASGPCRQLRRQGLVARACAALVLVAGLSAGSPTWASFGANLIVNPGAESAGSGEGSFNGNYVAGSLPGWVVSGELTAVSYNLPASDGYPQPTDPGPFNRGVNFFGGGYAGVSQGSQRISLDFANGAIQGAGAYYSLSGWLGGYAGQDDNARVSVTFLGAGDVVLGSSSLGPVLAADRGNATALLLRQSAGFVPQGAVAAEVGLTMTRAGGSSNDGYADNLGFSMLSGNVNISAPAAVAVGSIFTAQVAVANPFGGNYAGDELLAFGFDLGFDTTKLRLAGVQVAPGFDDDSAFFTDVSVAGSSFPGMGDAGQSSLALATLSFEVLAEGSASIEVLSDSAGNLNEGLTYANGANAELLGRTTLVLTAVPEPASAWLLLAGGTWLTLRRVRAFRLQILPLQLPH